MLFHLDSWKIKKVRTDLIISMVQPVDLPIFIPKKTSPEGGWSRGKKRIAAIVRMIMVQTCGVTIVSVVAMACGIIWSAM